MPKLLQLKTSLFANHGQSSQLSDAFVAAWQVSRPGAQVTVRDFAVDPVPHLDGAGFQAFLAKPEERTAEQQAKAAYADALVAELQAADVLVIGLPMYNLGIPSMLKAWTTSSGPALLSATPRPARRGCSSARRPMSSPRAGAAMPVPPSTCRPTTCAPSSASSASRTSSSFMLKG